MTCRLRLDVKRPADCRQLGRCCSSLLASITDTVRKKKSKKCLFEARTHASPWLHSAIPDTRILAVHTPHSCPHAH
ncbi:hypothetical protein E2C01_071058 [Portunus trituberculatus]|uniref:Uncharacterized protein n=1 Tax=Portunus trituberculatus TaxID=210409 RepID=A0A5B7HVY6_PORTR|nr:hypothetical protein [Portunus trituberculatus]